MTAPRFNIIASTFKYGEEDAQEELLDLLESLGDPKPDVEITDINGIVVAHTNIGPLVVVDSLRRLVKKEPWQVRYILRLIPIELMVRTNLDDLTNSVKRLAPKMHPQDTFRITIERRHTTLKPADIIPGLASKIDNKVQLKNPDWIVLVEIIGAFTGISILRSHQIFRSVIEKRNNCNRTNGNFGCRDTTV